MMESNIRPTLYRYKTILEKAGHHVLYIGLYGSQNYGADTPASDIDARAIVLPSVRDLVFNRQVSYLHSCPEGEIDVKGLPSFYEGVCTGSHSYVECMQTPYYLGDENCRNLFTSIPINPHSIAGVMYSYRRKFYKMQITGVDDEKRAKIIVRLFRFGRLLREVAANSSRDFPPGDWEYLAEVPQSIRRDNLATLTANIHRTYLSGHDGEPPGIRNGHLKRLMATLNEQARLAITTIKHYEPINLDDQVLSYITEKLGVNKYENSED